MIRAIVSYLTYRTRRQLAIVEGLYVAARLRASFGVQEIVLEDPCVVRHYVASIAV